MLNSSRVFLKNLRKPVRIALLLLLVAQLVVYGCYITIIPFHYDEWYSWRYFANTGFWNIFTSYPAPNNHVLYNMAARVFVIAGIKPELAMRLPSLLASLIASYYFFKLCRELFGSVISVFLLAILISLYNYIFYAVEARGYAFIYLFCVLLMYASLKLSHDYSGRYRLMLVLSQFFGLLTVPTFLYPMLPVGIVLFGYVAIQGVKQVYRLLLDYFAAFLLVVLGYSGILFIGDPQNFLHPQAWTEKFSFSNPVWFADVIHYLDTRFFELFGIYRLKTSVLLVLATLFYYFFNRSKYSLFMPVICALMFFSPFFIVLIQKVYPFGRSLYYLVIPSLLLLGFMMLPAARALKANFYGTFVFVKWVVILGAMLWLGFSLFTYPGKHREHARWDYEIKWIREHYPGLFHGHIHEIARTGQDSEFYPAEVFSHICFLNGNPDVTISRLDSVRTQDVLVIDGSEREKFRSQMKEYTFIYMYEDVWIYCRNVSGK